MDNIFVQLNRLIQLSQNEIKFTLRLGAFMWMGMCVVRSVCERQTCVWLDRQTGRQECRDAAYFDRVVSKWWSLCVFSVVVFALYTLTRTDNHRVCCLFPISQCNVMHTSVLIFAIVNTWRTTNSKSARAARTRLIGVCDWPVSCCMCCVLMCDTSGNASNVVIFYYFHHIVECFEWLSSVDCVHPTLFYSVS